MKQEFQKFTYYYPYLLNKSDWLNSFTGTKFYKQTYRNKLMNNKIIISVTCISFTLTTTTTNKPIWRFRSRNPDSRLLYNKKSVIIPIL